MRRAPLVLLTTGALLGGALLGTPAQASPAAPSAPRPVKAKATDKPDFDLREGGTAAEKKQLRVRGMRLQARTEVQSFTGGLGEQSLVDIDPLTGTPREVARLDGTLTGPAKGAAATIALKYVRAHADTFGLSEEAIGGLHLRRDYVDIAGIHHLSWIQQADGVPVYGNGLQANVAKDGRLVSVLGSPLASVRVPAQPLTLSGKDAIVRAKKDLGEASTAPKSTDVAKKVLFDTPTGLRIAWQTITMSAARPALHVVDAQSGRLLLRQSLTSDLAGKKKPKDQHALVYENYPGAKKGGSAHDVDLTKKGYLPRGSKTLAGNNVGTFTDVNDDNVQNAGEEVQVASNGSFRFHLMRKQPAGEPCKTNVCSWLPDTPYSWSTNRRQTSTQNFYYINNWHDHLLKAPIGFTEAAGNFETVNTTGKGLDADAVIDQPIDGANTDVENPGLPDGAHIDNANFATPPDGIAPTMQMYLWHQPGTAYPEEDPFIAVSGADTADVVYHEYTHGLSHRLVIDASGVPALDSQQGGSMGEAWSDWYALDYLVAQGLEKDTKKPGEILVGQYPLPGAGIRSEPLDCAVGSPASACPGTPDAGPGGYTYGDFGKISGIGPEVHADGEIWAQTLWQLRSALGVKLSESLVTRAMELSPTYPSFLDMRNAIVQADVVTQKSKHVSAIWKVFASRGMGFFAGTLGGDDTSPVESFALPPKAGTPRSQVSGTVSDALSNAPVDGATVAFGGHDSGFPGSYAATTDSQGRYTILAPQYGTYPDVYAAGAGYDLASKTVTIDSPSTPLDWSLNRDWASSSGGASIAATNGDEYADFGCGAAALIDQTALGWSANLPTDANGKYATIRLPKPVDLTSVTVDPSGTCGDDLSASTAQYRIETSTDGTTFTVAATGTFTPEQTGRANEVPLTAGTTAGVQYIRYTMLTTQAAAQGVSCAPDPTGAGCLFIDTSELEAYGR